MSFESWKEEFYPVEATSVKRKDALDHSIQKWKGIQPKNLRKHGCHVRVASVVDSNFSLKSLEFYGVSCALCRRFSCEDNPRNAPTCPIQKVTGKTCTTQYAKFVKEGSPRPMLNLLKKVKKALEEQ